MAITAGNTGTQALGSSVGSFNFTFDSGSGTDRILICQLYWQSAATISSMTYNSASFSTGISPLTLAFNERHALYYLLAPASGSNTLAVSFSTSTPYACFLTVFNGVDQSSPIGATRTETGLETGTTIAEALTTTVDDSWIYWGTRDYAGRTISSGADTVFIDKENTTYGAISARSSGGAPAGSRTLNLSANASANWFTDLLMEIKPATGGGGGDPTPTLMMMGVGT
jgi:hypothetical protein